MGDRQVPAPERILTAALDLFGRAGVDGTGIRAVAEQAGVSTGLVLHHFGSKEGLREACDDHVVTLIRETKTNVIDSGPTLLPGDLRGMMRASRPALRYLARTLGDGSPRLGQLLDDLVANSLEYTARAEAAGYVRPSADPRARTIVLTLWMFGALVLHEHLHRLLGVDLLDEDSDTMPYIATAMEILTDGVITDTAYQDLRPPATPTGSADDRNGRTP